MNPTIDEIRNAYVTPVESNWAQRYQEDVLGVYGPPLRMLVKGEGCRVTDSEGKTYLDMLGGIAVNVLGHAHPVLTSVVGQQWGTLGQISNFFTDPNRIAAIERLLSIAGAPPGSRAFLSNSGTEAMEAAIKISRRTGRTRILALEGAFHGRTMGALSLTYKEDYRAPFEPLVPGVEHIPFGDIDALETALTNDVAAFVVETIQGEGGVRPLPPGYLAQARELTRRAGALLIVDEIQTGMGRTGAWFSYQHEGILPDVLTVAKGLAGGYPIGATVTFGEDVSSLMTRGQHGSTFGGNPIAAAMALATMYVIERDGLIQHAQALGDDLRNIILGLGNDLIADVRGKGLLMGIALTQDIALPVRDALLDNGVIVNAVAPNVLRLAPPLILTRQEADEFVNSLVQVLEHGGWGT